MGGEGRKEKQKRFVKAQQPDGELFWKPAVDTSRHVSKALEGTPMECVLANMRAFCADKGRSLCFCRRFALFAATLLLFHELSLCLADYPGLCSRSPTGRHEKVRKLVPMRVQCEGGCGATEVRHFEWKGCKHCENTNWVETEHKNATGLRGCMCRKNRRSRDGDVYFDMESTWQSNRDSRKDRDSKKCCIQ